MDLLRTQKVRFLVSVYREMKQPVRGKEKRLDLIKKVCDLLQSEEDTKSKSEVCCELSHIYNRAHPSFENVGFGFVSHACD